MRKVYCDNCGRECGTCYVKFGVEESAGVLCYSCLPDYEDEEDEEEG